MMVIPEYEKTQIAARLLADEVGPIAYQRTYGITSPSGGVVGHTVTNDDNDDGYPDGSRSSGYSLTRAVGNS
jgi:hypothetical protein